MSVGGDYSPFREKYVGYANCVLGNFFQNYRPNFATVQKNTANGSYGGYDCAGGYTDIVSFPASSTTGQMTLIAPIKYFESACPGTGDCGGGTGGDLNRYGINAPLDPSLFPNTYAACDELAGVTVTNGGTGYDDGDLTLTIPGNNVGAYAQTIGGTLQVATFKCKVVGGVIQPNPKILTRGVYAGIGGNALSAQTTATGGAGSSATFSFASQSAKADLGNCVLVGRTGAAAFRNWQGTPGFLSTTFCASCPSPGDPNTPDDTKYLKITWDSHVQVGLWNNLNPASDISSPDFLPTWGDYPDQEQNPFLNPASIGLERVVTSDTDDSSQSVAENSGVVDYEATYNTSIYGYGTTGTEPDIVKVKTGEFFAKNGIRVDESGNPLLDSSDNTISDYPQFDYATGWNTHCYLGFPKCGSGAPGTDPTVDNQDDDYWVLQAYDVYDTGSGQPSFDANDYLGYTGEVYLDYYKITTTRTNDGYTWSFWHIHFDGVQDYTHSSPPAPVVWYTTTSTYHYGTVTLSDTNTSDEVVGDAENNLLQPWVLTDAKLMPPTIGGTKVVKVTRDEGAGDVATYVPYWIAGVPLVDGSPQVYTDPSTATGNIIGLPNTAGGDYPLDYFDPNFTNIQSFECGGYTCYNYLLAGYGDLRSNHPELPPRATQWTNDVDDDVLKHGQRVRRSHAYLTGSTCLDEYSSGIWSTKYMETAVRLPSFNHARPYGTDRSVKDQNHCVCVDSAVECDPAYMGGDCTRWNNVPPMAGRLAVSDIVDNGDGSVTVTHAEMPVINAADAHSPLYNVDLAGKAMAPLATNLVPSAVSTTQFTATAVYATVKDALWVTLYGALDGESGPSEVAKWHWCDDRGKGDFFICELWNSGNAAGYWADAILTTHSKGFNPHKPTALVLSPNTSDETSDYYCVQRYDFATAFVIDEQCGQSQYLDIAQAMVDPLFQTPFNNNCGVPGWCVPYVEARIAVPAGAPSGGNFAAYTIDPSGGIKSSPNSATVVDLSSTGFAPTCT